MKKQTIPCDRRNYGSRQGQAPEYIVIHYTAGDGDRAEENGLYFSRTCTGASAHWFVDEGEAVASVPEGQAAWHCGAAHYIHPDCRNENSIGVELCSRKEGDRYLFSPPNGSKRHNLGTGTHAALQNCAGAGAAAL